MTEHVEHVAPLKFDIDARRWLASLAGFIGCLPLGPRLSKFSCCKTSVMIHSIHSIHSYLILSYPILSYLVPLALLTGLGCMVQDFNDDDVRVSIMQLAIPVPTWRLRIVFNPTAATFQPQSLVLLLSACCFVTCQRNHAVHHPAERYRKTLDT